MAEANRHHSDVPVVALPAAIRYYVCYSLGKGMLTARMGAATKSHFPQALCRLIALSPAGNLSAPQEIVTLAHAEVARQLMNLESCVTVCYARLNLPRRQVALVDCGHSTMVH